MHHGKKIWSSFGVVGFIWAVGAFAEDSQTKNANIALAILGDSLSTGAATHPNLTFDSNQIWRVLNGEISVAPKADDLQHIQPIKRPLDHIVDSPRIFGPSIQEYHSPIDWAVVGFLQTLSSLFLNTREYSWGNQRALFKGLHASEVAIVAENGARANSALRQMQRLFAATGDKLPREVFLFFSGNDICAPGVSFITSPEEYVGSLESALHFAIAYGQAAQEGSQSGDEVRLVIPAFLNVLQLINSKAILDHEVRAFGSKVSCRKLREDGFRSPEVVNEAAEGSSKSPQESARPPMLSRFLPPNPAQLCPTLFSTMADEKERIPVLANHIRAYREGVQTMVGRVNEWRKANYPHKNIRVEYVADTGRLMFSGEEMAEDCFHLSVKGQWRLAQTIGLVP